MTTSTSPQRTAVQSLRSLTPYVNFQRPTLKVSHSHPDPWSGMKAVGSRDKIDDAPFTLWDEAVNDFRNPSKKEIAWIQQKYSASSIFFQWPIISITTDTSPDPVPLTVAGVAAVFTPIEDYNPEPILVNTMYGGRHQPDPLPTLRIPNWTLPSRTQIKDVAKAIGSYSNVRSITFMCNYLVAELAVDDRAYTNGSLPRRVAGVAIFYHHSDQDFWSTMENQARGRLIDPGTGVQDTTDYLVHDTGDLCPGIRLESASVSTQGEYATISRSTSAGLLLMGNHGQLRLTAANHGFSFPDRSILSNEVYHPSHNDTRIGVIEERWPKEDVALITLDPSVRFSNKNYFDAKEPRRLLGGDQVIFQEWYVADGMSTGAVAMFARGIKADFQVPRTPNLPWDYTVFDNIKTIFRTIGATGGSTKDGLCGAPIVQDDSDAGGVAGFFQLASTDYALSPHLDDIVAAGWALA